MMSWQQKVSILVLIALATLSMLYGVSLLGDWSAKTDCQHYHLVYQVETKITAGGLCWAKFDGNWYPVKFSWPQEK